MITILTQNMPKGYSDYRTDLSYTWKGIQLLPSGLITFSNTNPRIWGVILFVIVGETTTETHAQCKPCKVLQQIYGFA